MGLIDAAIFTNAVKSAGIVTMWVTDKSRRIRTYERWFNTMKAFNFNPCISHTYDDCARNPCISNTYEKHGGGGQTCCNVVQLRVSFREEFEFSVPPASRPAKLNPESAGEDAGGTCETDSPGQLESCPYE